MKVNGHSLTVGTLCAQLLQFHSDSFETLQMSLLGFEDMHVVGYETQINFYYFCSQLELSHFSVILTMRVNGQGVPCVRNSSYSFIPILLKLYKCLYNALKIRIWFAYNPQLNYYHFAI